MEPWMWAVLLKPFAFLVLAVLVLIPARMAAQRFIPEGKLKRILLWRIPK